jgi:hypothetical protein
VSYANTIMTWLLEEENPPARYFTLRELAGRPENDEEAVKARRQIMEVGPVPALLAAQNPGGYWGRPEDFYIRSKYQGTIWTYILLASLGANGKDPRLRQTAEFILANSQDRVGGGFSHKGDAKRGGVADGVIPCLSGNMLWCLIRMGYLEDNRVQAGIHWITSTLRFDDGETIPPDDPRYRYEKCWGRHTCIMGAVKSLKALAEIPLASRTAEVQSTLENGAEYLLKHHVFKHSHAPSQIAKTEWMRFGYPLMWNTDALEMLELLAGLGYRDERMNEAIRLVRSKQDEQGWWPLETTFNGRTRVRIERQGLPSKWVTLRALKTLKVLGY